MSQHRISEALSERIVSPQARNPNGFFLDKLESGKPITSPGVTDNNASAEADKSKNHIYNLFSSIGLGGFLK